MKLPVKMVDQIMAIDIGNTNIKIGIFQGNSLKKSITSSLPLKEASFYKNLFLSLTGGKKFFGAVLSSVLPSHTEAFCAVTKSFTGVSPLIVDSSIITGLTFDVSSPETIGPDRIANAVAAYKMTGDNVAVVDLGSATTITVVERNGKFTGGAIMPGLEMMFSVLNEKTGRLPFVKQVKPSGPLGKDTKSSIISGVMYGTAGAINLLLDEISSAYGGLVVLLTGGNAPLIKDLIRREHSYIPTLTLRGLKMIYERNRR